MVYQNPQVRIFQTTRQAPTASSPQAGALIMGGNAQLFRYDQADEKLLSYLGIYNNVGTNIGGSWRTSYSWPNKATGAKIDLSYTKLRIDNALLRYFQDTSETAVKKANNKIRVPGKVFYSNDSDYPVSSEFTDRNVKIGDRVFIHCNYSAVDYYLMSYITGFEADTVAASLGSATANSANQGTVSANATATASSGNSGAIVIGSASAASYQGYVQGDVVETYTVSVIQASTGGDLTTARLQITSASGHDDVASQVPAAVGYPTSIGTRGLTATFATGTGSNLAVGETWTISCRQTWTATVPTAAGTYTGTQDLRYIVEVTTGGISDGTPATDPYISVTTAEGGDVSGPTSVPTAAGTAVPIGHFGLTMSFSTAKLRKGDRFEVVATAAHPGNYRTLVLAHSLDSALPLDDDTINANIDLYIQKNITVPEKSETVSGGYNWTQTQTEFFANASIYSSDTDYPTALPVISNSYASDANKLYLEYRAWRSTTGVVNSISDIGDIDTALLGSTTQDNPLKYGLYKALQNNNGYTVKYLPVSDPADIDSWTSALALLENRRDIYNIAPMTQDAEILNLVQAHAQAQSGSDIKHYRVLWASQETPLIKQLLGATTTLATTEDDPGTSGTQYTLLRVTTSGVDLTALGVLPGDIVRYQYNADAWGTVTYSEYVVDAVLSADQIRLVSGTVSAENTPRKVEIWRNLSKSAQATEIAAKSGAWGDRRVRCVWAGSPKVGDTVVNNMFVAAALAGQAGGVPQHQGLTNSTLSGFDDLSAVAAFSRDQLNTMAGSGTWIVTQSPTGEVYTRHALTTGDPDNLNEAEEAITRNWDMICFVYDDVFSPYIGRANAVPTMLDTIRARFVSTLEGLLIATSPELGSPVVSAEITTLEISPIFRDSINLYAEFTLPYALNKLNFHTLV